LICFSVLMGVGRYELTDAQWSRIEGLLPGRVETVGRTAADNRVFINGVLWVLRSGAHWHDLPERYGKYKSVHKRFSRWGGKRGVGQALWRPGGRSQKHVSHDRFDDRACPPAGGDGPQKGGADKALGRSRGGMTTKIHLLANELGLPVDFLVTGGQVNDCTQAIELLGERRAEWVLADKGYDSQAILDHIEAMGAVAVVPSKSNRKQQRTHDKELYRKRNRIERCFSRLKHFRRFATRYEKIKQNFKALVALACSWLHLQLYVDTA